MKMYTLICPKCKNKMGYLPRLGLTRKNKKKCVYCGRSFTVVDQLIK